MPFGIHDRRALYFLCIIFLKFMKNMKKNKLFIRYIIEAREEAGKINEQEYLEYLIDHYQNLVFSVCYKITGNYFDAEDLAQDAFISAFKNFSRFDGRNEKAWICRIATNKCLDHMRKRSRGQVATEEDFFSELPDTSKSTEEKVLENQVKERLLQCCMALKPPYDEISIKYFYEERSVEEIATELNRNVKTVQTQIYRSKSMLQKTYGRRELHA